AGSTVRVTLVIFTRPMASRRPSSRLPLLSLNSFDPEAHVHLTQHCARRIQVLSRLVVSPRSPEELAQLGGAVGDERTHPEFLCQRQRCTVGLFGARDIGDITTGGNGPEQAKTPRLVTPLLMLLRQGQGLLRMFHRGVATPIEEVGLSEPRQL